MATLQSLNEAVTQTNEAVDMVIAQLNAIKENAIMPADLDAPVSAINTMKIKINEALQS